MNINIDAEPFYDLSVLVAQRHGMNVHPAVVSVLSFEAVFCVYRLLILNGITPLCNRRYPIFRVDCSQPSIAFPIVVTLTGLKPPTRAVDFN